METRFDAPVMNAAMEESGTAQLLICRVGALRLAIDAGGVRDVMPLLPMLRPPTLPAPLAGFVRAGGELLPVLSLAILLGLTPAVDRLDLFAHLVRPHGAGGRIPCLLVDRCEQVVPAGGAVLRPVEPENSHNGLVTAEVVLDDGVAHLVSLDRLLDEGERSRIASLTDEAKRRAHEWGIGEDGAGGPEEL